MMLKQKTVRSAFLTQGVLPMSSKFCTFSHKGRPRVLAIAVCLWAGYALAAGHTALGDAAVRFADIISIEGAMLRRFDGARIDHLAVVACDRTFCHPIPFQIDERDPQGRWVLDQGPEPNADDPPEVLD